MGRVLRGEPVRGEEDREPWAKRSDLPSQLGPIHLIPPGMITSVKRRSRSPRSLALGPRREEGIEHPVQILLRDPPSFLGDGKDQVSTGVQLRIRALA